MGSCVVSRLSRCDIRQDCQLAATRRRALDLLWNTSEEWGPYACMESRGRYEPKRPTCLGRASVCCMRRCPCCVHVTGRRWKHQIHISALTDDSDSKLVPGSQNILHKPGFGSQTVSLPTAARAQVRTTQGSKPSQGNITRNSSKPPGSEMSVCIHLFGSDL